MVRIPVEPSQGNGLLKGSPLMADKLCTLPTKTIGVVVGRMDATVMAELDLALRGWLELV